MSKTIHVTGTGSLHAPADLIEMVFYVEEKDFDYNKVMEKSSLSLINLTDTLKSVGFPEKAIKTKSFFVCKCTKNQREPDGAYTEVFDGYKCSQTLELKYDFSNDKLSNTITALSQSEASPRYDIFFTLKDVSSFHKKLLAEAVKDAEICARIIADAASMRMGEILDIRYASNQRNPMSQTAYKDEAVHMSLKAALPNINPSDICESEHVEITWELL